jgi:hypothetical protein
MPSVDAAYEMVMKLVSASDFLMITSFPGHILPLKQRGRGSYDSWKDD